MLRRNLFISAIALISGVLAGLYLKRFIETEVFDLIDSEARGSCEGCYLSKDAFNFSFLTLSGTGTDVKLMKHGKPYLIFDKVVAKVELSEIFSKRVIINLDLIKGWAEGVGPDTPTFDFIDHLTEPIAPEKDRPGRWKAKVNSVTVSNCTFTEDLGGITLRGNGVGLKAQREGENFMLYPEVKQLYIEKIRKKGTPSESLFKYLLGHVKGTVDIADNDFAFKNFVLQRDDTTLNFKGLSYKKPGNPLDGEIAFNLDSKSSGLDEYINGIFKGKGVVSGRLGNPVVSAEFSSIDDSVTDIVISEQKIASFETFNGRIRTDKVPPGDRALNATDLTATNPNYSLLSNSTVNLNGDKLSGDLYLHVNEITAPQIVASNIDLKLALSGELEQILTNFEATAENLNILKQDIGEAAVNFAINNSTVKYDLSTPAGILSSNGEIKLNGKDQAHDMNLITILLQDLPVYKNGQSKQGADPLAFLTGEIKAKGPLEISKALAEGKVKVDAPAIPLTLASSLKLEAGTLSIDGLNEEKSIKVSTSLNLVNSKNSSLRINVDRYHPGQALECSEFSFDVNYEFPLEKYETGNGQLKFNKGMMGCPPYEFNVEAPKTLPIKNGALNFDDLKISGFNTTLNLNGTLNTQGAVNLQAKGDMNVGAFSSSFKTFDDIQGIVSINSQIKGNLSAPLLNGRAQLKNLTLRKSGQNIEIGKFSGELLLEQDTIKLDKLTGQLNNGDLLVDGIVNLKNKTSEIKISFVDAVFQPEETVYASLNGQVVATDLFSLPSIKGSIDITNLKFEKSYDIPELARIFRNYIFRNEANKAAPAGMGKIEAPSYNLELQVKAERNVRIITNWFEDELKGQVTVTGSFDNPKISGRIESIDGWIGFKQRRFDITSASITLKDSDKTPDLDLIAESSIPTPTGELISVLLEARGKIIDPKITFTSDRGLSQKEILSMLVSTGELTSTTDNRSLGVGISYNDFSLIKRDSPFIFGNFLYNVTKIDKISVEPAYNTLTGAVEPAVSAEKKLTDRVTAKGEGLFGTTATQARGSISYQLSDLLNISTGVESLGAERPVSLGVDLSFTALSSQFQSKTVVIEGNKFFTTDEVLSFGSIKPDSIIETSNLSKVARDIEQKYKEHGFLSPVVQEDCKVSEVNTEVCSESTFKIQEGPRPLVDTIIIETSSGADSRRTAEKKQLDDPNFASKAFLEQTVNETTEGLRQEGYMSAKVLGSYVFDDANLPQIRIEILLGQKYKFTFKGNKLFSAQDFIDEAGLYKRKQPFGSNTVNTFLSQIEKMYREKGYLLATVGYTENFSAEDQTKTINIDINEETVVPVEEVIITGNDSLPVKEIKSELKKLYPRYYRDIFLPKSAIEEQIEQSQELLRTIYFSFGFINPAVSHSLKLSDQGDKVSIEYRIEEGERILIKDINLAGWPADVTGKAAPSGKYVTVNDLSTYISELDDLLKEHGYFNSRIESKTSEMSVSPGYYKSADISVIPGAQSKFGKLSIIGLNSVDKSTVFASIKFKEGDDWSEESIRETKRTLFKLGLFSKVDLSHTPDPADGNINDVEIRLVEKPLRTLELGIGANSVLGVHYFGEAQDKSLFRDGRTLSFRSDLYYDPTKQEFSQGSANALFTNPALLGTDISWVEDLRFQRLTILTQEFDVMRSSIGSFFFKTFDNHLTASLGHTFAVEDVSKVTPGAILSKLDNSTYNLSTISGNLNYDRRDNSLVPTKGYTLSSDFKFSSTDLASDADFIGGGIRGSFIHPLNPLSERILFAASSRFSSQRAFGDTKEIPITQRYYLGGRTSIRGFRENSLGPRGDEGAVIGGDVLQANSAELQYLLSNDLEVHTFLDSGNVFLRNYQNDFLDLRVSSGMGIRYRSPVGPIGFDLGFPLDQKPGEPSVRFHFSIGTNF